MVQAHLIWSLAAAAAVSAVLTGPLPTAAASQPSLTARIQPSVRGDVSARGVRWRSCPPARQLPTGSQCARYRVPWNWQHPDGRWYDVALQRLPALGGRTTARKPSLFVNPGGPGESGGSLLARFENYPILRRNFNIVSWDPRGVPNTSPAIKPCQMKTADLPVTGAFSWLQIAATIRAAQDNPQCVRINRAQLWSVGTNNVIQDLDALRAAVGDAKLTYIGFSYGTTIGRLYAMRYPSRVRAILMDGAVFPGNSMYGQAQSSTRGWNSALTFVLANTPPAIRAIGDQVSAYLQNSPINVRGQSVSRWEFWAQQALSARDVNPGAAYTRLVCDLASAASIPSAACQTQPGGRAGRRGNGSPVNRALLEVRHLTSPKLQAIRCTDYRDRPGTAAAMKFFESGGSRPPTGQLIMLNTLLCTGWPSPNVVSPMTRSVRTATPLLFINGIADSATSYWGAKQTARWFVGHRFITVNTGVHAIFQPGLSPCIRNPIERYLLSGKLPARNRYCRSVLD